MKTALLRSASTLEDIAFFRAELKHLELELSRPETLAAELESHEEAIRDLAFTD